MPSNAANLPPLCSTNDPLHHVLASECLNEICRGYIAGGQRNNEADSMDPRWRRSTDVCEGLQFLDRVPENLKLRISKPLVS